MLVSALAWRLHWRWQAFLSWAGLRGAVPIVLATIPMSARVPGATRVFDIVVVVVVLFTLLQPPAPPWAAGQLGLGTTAEPVHPGTSDEREEHRAGDGRGR